MIGNPRRVTTCAVFVPRRAKQRSAGRTRAEARPAPQSSRTRTTLRARGRRSDRTCEWAGGRGGRRWSQYEPPCPRWRIDGAQVNLILKSKRPGASHPGPLGHFIERSCPRTASKYLSNKKPSTLTHVNLRARKATYSSQKAIQTQYSGVQ